LVIAGIGSIGKCSSGGSDGAGGEASNLMETNITAGVAAQVPPPVEPLRATSITRGATHMRLAYRAEGLPGAMIYSQNCYDALTHEFSWKKLDTCGAFDMLAVRVIVEAEPVGFAREVGYFQSEIAAGRYLAAATGGGEEAAEADKRLSDVQARAARSPLPVPKAKPVQPAEAVVTTPGTANLTEPESAAEPTETEDVDL
jgi:hypothetical protein